MFVRTIQGKAKEYVVIVRRYKDKDGKYRQKTVQNLGEATERNRKELLAFGERLVSVNQGQEFITDGSEIQEISRQNWGCQAIIDSMWDQLNLQWLLRKKEKEIKLMLLDRVISPGSKFSTYRKREQYVGFEDLRLEDLYRGLDLLDKNKEVLKEHIFKIQKVTLAIDVVFFDVTTLYFESQKEDSLRNFGYSKDCKFNEVQIMLSLMISKEGIPLSYEIFPGNTFEGKTLVKSLMEMKKKYNILKVIIVADRGIGSKDNLKAIKEAGFEYVIGAKLGSASKSIKEEAIKETGYISLGGKNINDEIKRYKIIELADKDKSKWVILWSGKRAHKDKKDRMRLVCRAQEMLGKGTTQDKRGAKKYIKGEESIKSLNTAKIENDAKFDGYYALSFSDQSMAVEEIVAAYHGLWRVEESFRTLKSFFEVRPMFHWTPGRISGHVMLNFILLVMEADLLLKLKEQVKEISHNTIREAIASMQRSILRIGAKKFVSYASLDLLQKCILKTLKIKLPRNYIMT